MPGFLLPHVRKTFPPGIDSINFADGGDGSYWVEITFQPQPFLQSDKELLAIASDFIGDSHLIISDSLANGIDRKFCFPIECPSLKATYDFYCNNLGRLSHVNIQLMAASFEQSIKLAQDNLDPFLCGWAAQFNVPIYIFRIRAREQKTGIEQTTLYHQLYPRVRVSEKEMFNKSWSYPEDTRLLILYKEALNTTSPQYQFLCYFSVIDLAMKIRKKRTAESIKNKNTSVYKQERFNEEDWFIKILTPEIRAQVLGEKFTKILDILRPLRNQVAHALVEENNIESILTTNDQIYPYLPVAKRLAERLLYAEVGQNS